MSEPNSVLMQLNRATRRWHADVDEPWLELLRPNVSRADYLAQLVRTYGFVAPFESACMYTPNLGTFIASRHLVRAGLIAHDLLALGLSPAQVASIPHCDAITTYRDPAEALGWLYVVERSTLLHGALRRHLTVELPEVHHACAYLTADESRATDNWLSLGRTLDRVDDQGELARDVLGAAHEGFDCVRQWFRGARSHVDRGASTSVPRGGWT